MAATLDELRVAARTHRLSFDEKQVTLLIGRMAHELVAAGELDPEIGLSLVLWPTSSVRRAAQRVLGHADTFETDELLVSEH